VPIIALSGTGLAAVVGGVGTFVLAVVAVFQMTESRRQTRAMESQAAAGRDAAARELAAMREYIRASVEQGNAVREAARAQVQPIVFAEILAGISKPGESDEIGEGERAFPYRLSNEGTGVALNITHGVEIEGIEKAFGDGMHLVSLGPGITIPPDEGLDPTHRRFEAPFREDELPENWGIASRTYWVRFENVFGEQFETRVPYNPQQSSAFMRTTELPVAEPAPPEPAPPEPVSAASQSSSVSSAAASQPDALARQRWTSQTSIVAITAIAAVLGAAVGGFATYLGNNQLQNSQNRTAARGAGRVLQADFVNAATRVEFELEYKRYVAPESESVVRISEDDEKLIASNVGASTWNHVAAAKAVLQEELSSLNSSNKEVLEARAHRIVVLQGTHLQFEESVLQTLDRAILGLKKLTGTTSAE
jgi:hypothetical protein